MPKTLQTPASVLKALMDDYQLNPFSMSKKIGLSTSALRQISMGHTGITIPTALRLAKFFGQPPSFWLDLQLQVDMQAAANDKNLQKILGGIPMAEEPKVKPAKKTTLVDKRKKAAKVPGAKPASRKPEKK